MICFEYNLKVMRLEREVQVNCAIKDLFFVILIKLPIHLSSCGVQTCELG